MKHENQHDFSQIPILNPVLDARTTDPSSPTEGQVWTRNDLHLLKVYLNSIVKTLATTDDSRFTDSRTPSGAAGGDLASTYPNPTIGSNKVTIAHLALALLESGVSGGTAATTDPALRKLGTGANDAMPGNARLDQLSAPTADVAFGGRKITGLADGVASTDGATVGQITAAIEGRNNKQAVKYASIGAGGGDPAASNFSATTGANSRFGVSGASNYPLGTRLLFKNETGANEKYNGIYEVTSNDGSFIGVTRASDMNTWAEVPNTYVFVETGSLESTGWLVTTDTAGGTLGTTAITWVQVFGSGTVGAGAGLSQSGTALDVNVDNSSLEINADTLRVKALGIIGSMIAAGTIDLTTKVTGILPIANGGTGGSSASAARSALGVLGKDSAASPALTAGVWTDVTHGLGSGAQFVQFLVASTDEPVDVDWRRKAGAINTTIQIKTDIPAGRALGYYNIYMLG